MTLCFGEDIIHAAALSCPPKLLLPSSLIPAWLFGVPSLTVPRPPDSAGHTDERRRDNDDGQRHSTLAITLEIQRRPKFYGALHITNIRGPQQSGPSSVAPCFFPQSPLFHLPLTALLLRLPLTAYNIVIPIASFTLASFQSFAIEIEDNSIFGASGHLQTGYASSSGCVPTHSRSPCRRCHHLPTAAGTRARDDHADDGALLQRLQSRCVSRFFLFSPPLASLPRPAPLPRAAASHRCRPGRGQSHPHLCFPSLSVPCPSRARPQSSRTTSRPCRT